jgi:deoxyribonucleoside regulator
VSKDTELLVRIASLYYEQGINQNEIAEICQIERSRVSRLLLQARKMGIVQFHVVDPAHNDHHLDEQLQESFGLQQALVFDTLNVPEHQLKKTIGLVAADYLTSILKEGDIFAISWGETIYHTIQGLQTEFPLRLIVVPAVGGSGLLSPAYQINEMTRKAAESLGGFNRTLYAPAFVESKETRDALVLSKDIQAIVDLWKTVTVALVGIGKSPFAYRTQPSLEPQFGQFYLYSHEQQELREMDVTGDINARFFDRQGRELDTSVHARIIGMKLVDLKRVPNVIAVAGGIGKVDAIYGALQGKCLDVLITDSFTAQKLLDKQSTS